MIGVVLCGGQSSRMGIDKGLIDSEGEGKVWAKIARNKFSEASISSLLSINKNQTKNYLRYFKDNDLVVDNSTLKKRGPLLGVLSVHLKYPQQDLMVIACDMINVNELLLKRLFDSHNPSKYEATVFKGERIEPLCGVYSWRGLNKIHNANTSNDSMMRALEKLETSYIPIPEEWKYMLKNFNSPEDLNQN